MTECVIDRFYEWRGLSFCEFGNAFYEWAVSYRCCAALVPGTGTYHGWLCWQPSLWMCGFEHLLSLAWYRDTPSMVVLNVLTLVVDAWFFDISLPFLKTVLSPSPNSKKSGKRRRNCTNLRGQISMVPDSFRKIDGRSERASHIKFDLEKSKQETVGIFFRQGDGFDRDSGIFVSRLEMGCTAEIMGLHVGDEVVEVNDVDVAIGDIEWVEMLMKVVNVVVLKVRKRTHGAVTSTLFLAVSPHLSAPPHPAHAV